MEQTIEEEVNESVTPTEELRRLQEATNEDGTVTVDLLDWEKEGEEVRIDFHHPTEGELSEQMEWPTMADGSTKFERVLASAGYQLDEADRVRSENATLRAEESDGEWCLVADEASRISFDNPSMGEQVLYLVIAPLATVGLFMDKEPEEEITSSSQARSQEFIHRLIPYTIGIILWTAGITALLL